MIRLNPENYRLAIEAIQKKPIRRFLNKSYRDSSGCLIWECGKTNNGYGLFGIKVAKGKRVTVLAHRLAYLLAGREIPDGYVLDHLCRVPSCTNPDHLEPVTTKENIVRGVIARGGRNHSTITHCPQGHQYSTENTYIATRRRRTGNYRICKTCLRLTPAQKQELRLARQRQMEVAA